MFAEQKRLSTLRLLRAHLYPPVPLSPPVPLFLQGPQVPQFLPRVLRFLPRVLQFLPQVLQSLPRVPRFPLVNFFKIDLYLVLVTKFS